MHCVMPGGLCNVVFASCKPLCHLGKLFILHGDHGDSHFVGILVDDIAEIAKTFLQTESTGRDPDNLLRWIISHFLSNVFAGVPNENKIRRKGCTQRSR